MYFTVSVGCNKHFCFKPLAHRSVKLTFSRRSLKAVVRSPCQAVTMTLTTNVRMCIYVNECSLSLYPTVIKNIIKVLFIAYFLLNYDQKREFLKLKTILKEYYHFFLFVSVELRWHTVCHDRVSIWWSLDAKNT